MNKRIQRKRTKGWIKPENCVYVGRPSKWSNPYKVTNPKSIAERERCLILYTIWLQGKLRDEPHYLDELKGKDICCWCRIDSHVMEI